MLLPLDQTQDMATSQFQSSLGQATYAWVLELAMRPDVLALARLFGPSAR